MSDFTIVGVSAPTPTSLSTKSSPGLILLNWDDQEDVRSTLVYESTTNNRNNSILLGETTETTFADSVSAGETRYYWIRHRNEVGLVNGDFFPTDVSAGVSAISLVVEANIEVGDITEADTSAGSFINGISAAPTSANGPYTTQLSLNFATDSRQINYMVVNYVGIYDMGLNTPFPASAGTSATGQFFIKFEVSATGDGSFQSEYSFGVESVALVGFNSGFIKQSFIPYSKVYKNIPTNATGNIKIQCKAVTTGTIDPSPGFGRFSNEIKQAEISYQFVYK